MEAKLGACPPRCNADHCKSLHLCLSDDVSDAYSTRHSNVDVDSVVVLRSSQVSGAVSAILLGKTLILKSTTPSLTAPRSATDTMQT
jgi:hypothetical protein